MARTDWQEVVAGDFAVPDAPLDDLSAELTRLLGSPDPHLRDDIALSVLSTWIDRGVYDDLLPGLGDGMAAGLQRGLGEVGTDTVYRRSFSALALASCLDRTNREALVPDDKVLDWGDRLLSWLVRERDVRGFVPGSGWAHAVAHGADAVGTLARSPALGRAELTAVLDTLADRLLLPSPTWVHGEPDRLALATLEVLRRELVPFDVVERWVRRVARAADAFDGRTPEGDDPYGLSANPQAFLRALHLHTLLTPEPPSYRSDLVLTLVVALRESNAPFHQVTGQ